MGDTAPSAQGALEESFLLCVWVTGRQTSLRAAEPAEPEPAQTPLTVMLPVVVVVMVMVVVETQILT